VPPNGKYLPDIGQDQQSRSFERCRSGRSAGPSMAGLTGRQVG
jgi:hypothetical protein